MENALWMNDLERIVQLPGLPGQEPQLHNHKFATIPLDIPLENTSDDFQHSCLELMEFPLFQSKMMTWIQDGAP